MTKRRTIATFRRRSSGSPSWSSSQVAKSVKTVKLATSPATIRSGLRPDAPPASRIGSTGQDARRDGRDHAGEKADAEQDEHLVTDPVCR